MRAGARAGLSDTVDAVLWTGQFANAAKAVDALPCALALQRLAAGLDVMAAAIAEAGGTILKLGDHGIVAVFPLQDQPAAAAAEAALMAAESVVIRLAALPTPLGRPPFTAEIALHRGAVGHGTLEGCGQRSHVVVGRAAEEAVALRRLCPFLRVPIITSGTFAQICPRPTRRLGSYSLRGLVDPQEAFAPVTQ